MKTVSYMLLLLAVMVMLVLTSCTTSNTYVNGGEGSVSGNGNKHLDRKFTALKSNKEATIKGIEKTEGKK